MYVAFEVNINRFSWLATNHNKNHSTYVKILYYFSNIIYCIAENKSFLLILKRNYKMWYASNYWHYCVIVFMDLKVAVHVYDKRCIRSKNKFCILNWLLNNINNSIWLITVMIIQKLFYLKANWYIYYYQILYRIYMLYIFLFYIFSKSLLLIYKSSCWASAKYLGLNFETWNVLENCYCSHKLHVFIFSYPLHSLNYLFVLFYSLSIFHIDRIVSISKQWMR